MTDHDFSQGQMPWHALLNCPEARVLEANEERELLVELVECKNRILESMPVPEGDWGESPGETAFQQIVRALASLPAGLDSLSGALQPVAKRYQQARSKLALANVRLVAHVAKRYAGRGVAPGDLLQEGICSLLGAIDRFDIANQTRLATYAIWWVRQGIQRAIAASAYPVRLNPRQLLRLAQFSNKEGGEPCAWLSRYKRSRADLAQTARAQSFAHLQAATRPTLSLDARSQSDGVTAVVDYLMLSNDDETQAEESNESVGVLIEHLDPREQLVLTLRFGLKGSEQQTLVQVSKVLGVSKERVRQIEARALRRLREGAIRSR
jgi:RNA polymerase primary sigma factor